MRSLLKKLFGNSDQPPAFHSKFGGMWIDRSDAASELKSRRKRGRLSGELEGQIATFMADGYTVIPGAVTAESADRLAGIVKAVYRDGDSRLRYHTDGREHLVPNPGTDPRGTRIVESHAVLGEVRDALSAPQLVAFLTAVFDEQPVLTQTLIFHFGSEQGYHQDPTFVVYDQPLKMAAAWIALEDIPAGVGELRYIVGSHRLPDFTFSTGRRDSHGSAPGELDRYFAWLDAESNRRGLRHETFLAKKGDVLVWHADLVHGGSPVITPGSTRLSLVGHFCPASVAPNYGYAGIRHPHGGILYSSYLYDLNQPVEPS